MTRIHILVDESEKKRFAQQAKREGKSLGAWLRDAARDRVAAAEARVHLNSVEDLDDFFARCTAREAGREPDWEEHLRVIEAAKSAGSSET